MIRRLRQTSNVPISLSGDALIPALRESTAFTRQHLRNSHNNIEHLHSLPAYTLCRPTQRAEIPRPQLALALKKGAENIFQDRPRQNSARLSASHWWHLKPFHKQYPEQ
jgi:hypothetical protein